MTAVPPIDRPLRIALAGLGTVGGEVARGLFERAEGLARAAGGRRLVLAVVADPDPSRPRELDLAGTERIADATTFGGRDDIDVVVELIGGTGIAASVVRDALGAGRSVVTANKALLSRRGAELEALARERGAWLRFEAAVGGGIPVLGPIAADLAGNRFRRVRGIVNGSTNYVLSAMTAGGRAYEDVVAEARELGYLEADPSTDVEGRDAADKVAILTRLAFGGWPDVAALRRAPALLDADGLPGITGITVATIGGAARLGFMIKLVGLAEGVDSAGVRAGVVPAAVPIGSTLGSTHGVTNVIEVVGEPVGCVSFVGPGAGGAATSSAVLGDLVAVARGAGSTWASLPPAGAIDLAGDLFDGPRRWLATVPGPLRRALAGDVVEASVAVPVGDTDAPDDDDRGVGSEGAGRRAAAEAPASSVVGQALLTRPVTLDTFRAALRAAGAPSDTVIYPVVED
jgi:homoserine dehydrogenase